MYEISRRHFHGVPVGKLCFELPKEEKERLAKANGKHSEYGGSLRRSWWKFPPELRSGLRVSCSPRTMDWVLTSSIKEQHPSGGYFLELCAPLGPDSWQDRDGGRHETHRDGGVPRRDTCCTAPEVGGTSVVGSHSVQVSYDAHQLTLAKLDLSFAADGLAHEMQVPTTKHLEEPKSVGRHLRGRPVGEIVFEQQTLRGVLEGFCDAHHAGDLGTRKSRSGMAMLWRAHRSNTEAQCKAQQHSAAASPSTAWCSEPQHMQWESKPHRQMGVAV